MDLSVCTMCTAIHVVPFTVHVPCNTMLACIETGTGIPHPTGVIFAPITIVGKVALCYRLPPLEMEAFLAGQFSSFHSSESRQNQRDRMHLTQLCKMRDVFMP
jgi:hypothetical protein